MKLATFLSPGGAAWPALVQDGRLISLQPAGFSSVVEIIASAPGSLDRIRRHLETVPNPGIPLSSAVLLAPIPRPPKILCAGLNYRDHAAEAKMEIPSVPTIFSKYHNTIIGPGAPIRLPKNAKKPDYEAEFAFVIGRGGRHIPAEQWREHVFGYLCFHDVSARDFQLATSQWLMGKTFDGFAPTGPWITTADEIEDPHELSIEFFLNGERMQSSNTRELIFKIPELITFISSVLTLEPGDIIATGTPSGVGFSRKPPRWLRPGDEAVVRIEGLGELRNPVVAES
jgi:2-keto-4-pentenoate hydratase/2-oxohepta-3-ene-1,7-dioic acid hydratase in catechol pathway